MAPGMRIAAGITVGFAAMVAFAMALSPGGHLNFLHSWPGQTPPPGDGGTRDDYAV
jgi:hypothetical protein